MAFSLDFLMPRRTSAAREKECNCRSTIPPFHPSTRGQIHELPPFRPGRSGVSGREVFRRLLPVTGDTITALKNRIAAQEQESVRRPALPAFVFGGEEAA
jgi:hypothetical protein